MANKIDQFWEIFKAVAGETSTVTDSINAIAKSDRTKVESYFSNVIDQYTFETKDYNRLRKFMINLYASFRAQSTISLSSSDPHSVVNSDLDELFRSMGYNLSTSLKGVDENPLEQKVQFFLDLVNLYKVKGTPQSLVDVLQYYGVTEVDIYEFFLKKDAPDSLFFDGKAVAGTTASPNTVGIPYNNLTATDPHWLYTAQQILQLDQINKINLPSKSPYLGIQPTVNLEGAEISIIQRLVQDQYDSYISTGVLPTANAEITYTGEVVSFLELYLACIYMFNKLYNVGYDNYLVKPKNFICYDGTNVSGVDIISEFDLLTKQVVLTRDELKTRYDQYIDTFSRPVSMNFLIDKSTAGTILNSINPTFKYDLDNAGDQEDVMYSLLKDLALWVRANVGFGFVSFGFILFGLQEFFNDLKPVIDFFKPYRARLILLESLQVKNRLFNTIAIEDEMSVSSDITFHDYVTGDSNPCCNMDDSTCTNIISVYKREFVDGATSYNWRSLWATETEYAVDDAVASGVGFHWICIQTHESGYETKPGIGTEWTLYWDLLSEVVCTEEQPTRIKCTSDGTSIVCIDTPAPVSYYSRETYDCDSCFDIGAVTDLRRYVPHINQNPIEPYQIEYSNDPAETNVQTTIEDSIYDHLRCPAGSDATGGAVVSEITSLEYETPYSQQIDEDVDSVEISLNGYFGTSYSIGLSIRFDATADILENLVQFTTLITEKTVNSFMVLLSGTTPSENYYVDWYILDSTCSDIINIDATCTSQIITLPSSCTCSDYSISGVISNYVDPLASVYGYTITDKTSNQFTINFSGPIESENYQFEYFVCIGVDNGNIPIAPNSSTVNYLFPVAVANDVYPLITMLESDGDVYAWTVTEKTETGFTVELSDPAPVDSTNFNMSWSIPTVPPSVIDDITYYQSGGFRDFDVEGTFDCTHGFDLVQITIEKILGYMLQENGAYILQEDGNRILL